MANRRPIVLIAGIKQEIPAGDTVGVAQGGTGVTTSTGTATSSVVLSDSPALTGTPTVPTAAPGTNTTQAASTGFTAAAIATLVSNTIILANGVDLNTVVTSGFYRLSGAVVNGPGGESYSQMIVCRGLDTISQIVFIYGSGATFTRSGNPSNVGGGGAWSAWQQIAFTAGPTFTGIVTAPYYSINRAANVASGIQWYNTTYNAWVQYMGPAGTAGQGPKGTLTPNAGTLVTTWAMRSFIENGAGFGWTFESGTSSATAGTIMAEISAVDGSAKFAGTVTAPTFSGALSGNSTGAVVIDGDRTLAAYTPSSFPQQVKFHFANAAATGTGGNYAGVMTWAPYNGLTSSTGDASYQIAVGSTATNGSGTPRMRIRNGIDSTWNPWHEVITDLGAAFTGAVTLPTPAQFDNSTNAASTAFVARQGLQFSAATLVSAATTLTASQAGSAILFSTSGAITVTLPLLSGIPFGGTLAFYNAGGYTVTLARSGPDSITLGASAYTSVTIKSGENLTLANYNGTNWEPIAGTAQMAASSSFGAVFSGTGYQ